MKWIFERRFKYMIPEGFKEIEGVTNVYLSENQIVVVGIPDEDDEDHNCDYMGCGSLTHVLFRTKFETMP
jgi:hypothetical protein